MMSWNRGKHGSVVGAPMAPHIVTFVSAKTVPFASILGAWRGARIGVYCEVPRACTTLASHGGSHEHGCGDQCRRQRFQLGHSTSPFDTKSQQRWTSLRKW